MKEKKNPLQIIISDILFIFGTSLMFAVPWALKNYPMQFFWNVFFVLTADTSGHDSGTGRSILFGFVIPTVIVYALYKTIIFLLNKKKSVVSAKNQFCFSAVWCVFFVIMLIIRTNAWNYITVAKEVRAPATHSEFYEKNYVSPEEYTVIPAEKKQNLVIIFMESMEVTFSDIKHGGVFEKNLIPNLTDLAQNNTSFGAKTKDGFLLKNGKNLQGTSWTVAGLLSKTMALPYFLPFTQDSDENSICLPNATGLGDILFSQGYNLIFAMGSEKQFENRDIVLESHGFLIHDIQWYKVNGLLDENYQVFWGFEDAKLYSLAKKELTELSKKEEPFCYGLLTVDSHFPNGYTCELCKNEYEEPIMNVISCADRQVYDFVSWIKAQDWYKNTTIVILGDHAYLDAPKNNFITRQSKLPKNIIQEKRGFYFTIINPAFGTEPATERDFSSFDVMPTVIESLGNRIKGSGIALGRSLFSKNKTLCEEYSSEEIEKEIMKKNIQYDMLKK